MTGPAPIRQVGFSHAGKDYQLTAVREGNGLWVQATTGGKPVGPRYGVTFETADDFRVYRGESAVDELMRMARNDIEQGRTRGA